MCERTRSNKALMWERVNGGGLARRRQRRPCPGKPTTCHDQSIISSVPSRKLGLGPILGGSVMLVGWHAAGRSAARNLGDALFLGASLLTAGFTVAMSRAKLDPLHAAALVSTGSLALYGPLYLAFCGARLARLPAADFAVHAVFQGLVVTIISVVLYGRAIVILGASGAAFGAWCRCCRP